MPLPLSALPPGSRARIVALNGGYGSMRRLMEMGLTPGTVVEVVRNGPGPIILRVRGAMIALGRGLASKILVEPAG